MQAPQPHRPPTLPPNQELVEVLVDRDPTWVLRVRLGDRTAVTRVSPSGEGEVGTELAVLAELRHPGLAQLLDHGSLADGRSFVTRAWVEGEDLSHWAAERSGEELGEVVLRLCAALESLHATGFVHGDVKPSNVVVDPSGHPVLCDYGLARRSELGALDTVSGTLFSIAPEVLLGMGATPRSDLFGLGVLLHELLVGRTVGARDFYGRFPADDFWTAVGSRPDQLPDWCRDVVAALVQRDPNERPASAAAVARTLAGRLGSSYAVENARAPVRWPFGAGRERATRELLAALAHHGDSELQLIRIEVPEFEGRSALCDHFQLEAGLSGASVARVDLKAANQAAASPAELERWAQRRVAGRVGHVLFAVLTPDSPGSEAALRTLVAQARNAAQQPAAIVVVASGGSLAIEDWQRVVVGPLTTRDVRAFVDDLLPRESETRRGELAEALVFESDGSAAHMDSILSSAFDVGWLIAGERTPRLRPGPLPERLARAPEVQRSRSRHTLAGLPGPARELLAAVLVCGPGASTSELAEVAGLDAPTAEFKMLREVALLRGDGNRGIAVSRSLDVGDVVSAVGTPRWREMNGRWARVLGARGEERRALPHRVGAGDAGVVVRVRSASARLRDVGRPELALDLVELCIDAARRVSDPVPGVWIAERAAAWCSLGRADRALAEVGALPEGSDRDALAARVKGLAATFQQDFAEALRQLEEAARLDSSWRGEAVVARANVLYYGGRDDELLEWWSEIERSADELPARQVTQARSLVALSRFRLGQIEEARAMLEVEVEAAVAAGDALSEVGMRVSLATIERRAGSLEHAEAHLRAAERVSDEVGSLVGLAQARMALGGVLRERGELIEGQEVLESTVDLRERMGDAGGALVARGVLALHLADRGHLRAALEELDACIAGIRGPQRKQYVPVLEARRAEVRARLGKADVVVAGAQEPRTLVLAARVAWLAGRAAEAARLASQAARSAEDRGLGGSGFDARWIVDALACESGVALPVPTDDERALAPLVFEDRRLLGFLLSAAPYSDLASVRGWAQELEGKGRDDRAARLWCALAVRAGDDDAADRARRLFERCSQGADVAERLAISNALLGIPDPRPEELELLVEHYESGDTEMDVLALLEINRKLVDQVDLHNLLGAIVESALSVSGAERGFLMLEEHGELRFDTALDSRRGQISEPDLEVSRSVVRETLDRGEPLRISDAVDDPLVGGAPSVVSLDLRSVVCVPFDVSDGLRGVLYVDHRQRAGAFPERAERLLGLLGDQASLAIRQVRRLEEIRQLNERLNEQVVQKESDLRTARHELERVGLPSPVGGLVGNSPAMREVHRMLQRVAPTSLPILVTGESGTGKELAARAVHDLGPFAKGPFVAENCAAIPESLFESELFGHRKGAFTGAHRDQAGMFERAQGGTLFLDEIGEMPVALQAKLLRVLETSEVRRLGDDELRKVDFRIVVATNRDLEEEVAAGRFRADLFYRLNGVRLHLPSLAERTEDIPALVDHFVRLNGSKTGQQRQVSGAVLAALNRRPWPGNVRELSNEIARLCALSEGDLVEVELVTGSQGSPKPAAEGSAVVPIVELERRAIQHAMDVCGGDKREAARMLGISRAKIYSRLKEWSEE